MSMYLSISDLIGVKPLCGVLHGCDTVLTSVYSKLFGIPLAFYGVVFYVAGSIIAPFTLTSSYGRMFALLYGIVGAGFSAWFVYIQLVLIGAVCVYCMTSAFATLIILISTFLLWRKGNATIEPSLNS